MRLVPLPAAGLGLAAVLLLGADAAPPVTVAARRVLDVESGRFLLDAVVRIDNGTITAVETRRARRDGHPRPRRRDPAAGPDRLPHPPGRRRGADALRRPARDRGPRRHRGVHNARKTIEAGFTTVRDLGARDFADVALRDAIAGGQRAGSPHARGGQVALQHGRPRRPERTCPSTSGRALLGGRRRPGRDPQEGAREREVRRGLDQGPGHGRRHVRGHRPAQRRLHRGGAAGGGGGGRGQGPRRGRARPRHRGHQARRPGRGALDRALLDARRRGHRAAQGERRLHRPEPADQRLHGRARRRRAATRTTSSGRPARCSGSRWRACARRCAPGCWWPTAPTPACSPTA